MKIGAHLNSTSAYLLKGLVGVVKVYLCNSATIFKNRFRTVN